MLYWFLFISQVYVLARDLKCFRIHVCVLLTIKKCARNSLRVPALIIIVFVCFFGKTCSRMENQGDPSSSEKSKLDFLR